VSCATVVGWCVMVIRYRGKLWNGKPFFSR
jgi:hypothetical protein